MNDRHEDFRREPSKPHQCLHFSYETGVRCRAIAMHNHLMCYAHHDDVIPSSEALSPGLEPQTHSSPVKLRSLSAFIADEARLAERLPR